MWLAAMQLISGRTWQDNRERIAAELASLPGERPLLVLLPENFALFGERQGYLDGAEPLGNGPIQQQLSDWAKSHGIWLVAGAMPTAIAGADHIHTSTLVFDPDGELRGHYHKIHLFDVDVADNHGRYRESETFSPGDQPVLVDSPLVPSAFLSVMICAFPSCTASWPGPVPGCCWCLPPLPPSPARRTGSPCCGPVPSRTSATWWPPTRGHPRDRASDLGPQHGDRPLGPGAGLSGVGAGHCAGAAGWGPGR